MPVTFAQPDVPAFMLAWLATLMPSSPIAGVAVDVGRLDPQADPSTAPRILIEEAGALHHPMAPAYLPFRLSVTVYGRTENQAATILRQFVDLVSRAGPVVLGGVGLWKALDETGPQPRRDPDTTWPARFSVLALYMADVTGL